MNIKRLSKVLLCVAVVGALFTGCGSDRAADKKNAQVNDIRVGMLTHLNASEQKMNDLMRKIDDQIDVDAKLSHQYTYYDKLTSMQLGLEAGNIDEMSLYTSVASYLIGRNDKMSVVERPGLKLQDSFCLGIRKEDVELKNELDKAIESMKADGTLNLLVRTYIKDLTPGEEPPKVAMPKIDGAPVLKIAITGDLPPLDLVLADGQPAGFNTAVLDELAKRLNRNIEIVQVDSAARAAALVSKKVDVVFWTTVPYGDTIVPLDIDKPEGLEVTIPYYMDNIVHVSLKKDK